MTLNTDRVKYQLEKAQTALREALKYGAEEISPYQLGNIVDALKELDNAGFSLRVEKLSDKEEDTMWKEFEERTVGRPGFKFHATTEFVSAQPN